MQMAKTRACVPLCLLFSLLLTGRISGQTRSSVEPGALRTETTPAGNHLGYPEDWSSRHLVMPGNSPAAAVAAGSRDPRYVYNMVKRQVAIEQAQRGGARRKRRTKIDWAVSLENGFVPQDQFPAKYRFSVTSEDCNSDYVLLGLTVNSGTQANLVGINNLYTEATPKCNGGSPWVAFAYNTVTHAGGQIVTSPVISGDGTKAAFSESTPTGSYFHVLVLPNPIPVPPAQSGTVLAPLTPTACATPTTPGCMTTVQISTAADTGSSPWIDYISDTAYVGADDGKLYKIQPVFGGGAPQLVSDSNWPVTVVTFGTSTLVTDPVVDNLSGRIFMGDGNGFLYAISLTSPAHAAAANVSIGWIDQGPGTAIVNPPIVVNDPANLAANQVFVFTGCSNVLGIGGAVSQISANFSTNGPFATVDLGSAQGIGDCTTGNVHAGTFDNQFWINGTTGGHMMACGFVSGTPGSPLIPSNPRMYFFPFDTNHLITGTGSTNWLVNNTIGDECSPLTEFFDGATDRAFFGVGSSDGFLASSILTTSASVPNCAAAPTASCVTAPAALGGTSGIVVDNQVSNGGANIYFSTLAPGSVNGQKCNVPGGLANPYCAVKVTQLALQ